MAKEWSICKFPLYASSMAMDLPLHLIYTLFKTLRTGASAVTSRVVALRRRIACGYASYKLGISST